MPAIYTPSIESLSVRPQVKMFWRLLTLSLLATSCISASGLEWYKDISASDVITLKLDAQVGPVSRVEKVTKDSVEVQWELGSNRNRPRIQGYELQYLILAQGAPNEEEIQNWVTVQGQTPTTWVISTRSNETIADGFFTIKISVPRPPPSRLPSLEVVSNPIPWNSSWQVLTSAIEAPLRESQDPHYSTWTTRAIRCDETEEWDALGAWVGGCPYKEIGLFAWHLEFKPPEGVDVIVFPPPSLSLAEEDMYRTHVLVERYSTIMNCEENTINSSDDYLELIDPYFCRDVCSWWVQDLKPGRSYIFRVRSFNYVGMGDYGPPTNVATMDINCPPPTMRAPLFSSAARDYITVSCPSLNSFCQSLSTSDSTERISLYDFQMSDVNGDGAWTTIGQISPPSDPIQATWLVVTANNLEPATPYKFRARVLLVDGQVGQWSPLSPPYSTLPPLPNTQEPPEPLPANISSAIDVRLRLVDDIDPTDDCKFVLQSQISGSTRPWVHVATSKSCSSDNIVTANGLKPNNRYRFRWQVTNSAGQGEWSLPSVWARTLPTPFISINEPANPLPFNGSSNLGRILSGQGSAAGHNVDLDYVNGSGIGGIGPTHGSPGMASLRPQTVATLQRMSLHTEAAAVIFLSSGEYYVPHDSSIIAVQVKLWGGGGGGTKGYDNIVDSNGSVLPQEGGGGGYVEALLSVTSGEHLMIHIGSGGKQPIGSSGGLGGEGGGGMGGNGVIGGAGGGGMTSIMRGHDALAIAGGGGGAGASGGLCCSHGGAGGGHTGLQGLAPGNDSLSAKFSTSHTVGGGGDGGHDTIGGAAGISDSSEWDLSGGTRIEQFIPEENPGVQVHNELQSPLNWNYYVVEGGGTTTTQAALAGQFGQAGKGGSGKNGGGGGGSGYFGGGGGGPAMHSGGGGGGSSYISSQAVLYLEQVAYAPPVPTLHFVSDNGATIKWTQPPNITLTIELAVGAISIEFENIDYSLESTTVNMDTFYTAYIEDLFPRTEYQVRLVSSSIETFPGMRGGRVLPRGPVLTFITTDSPQNYWSILSPLAKDGFPSPIVGHTLSWGGASDPKGLWLFGGHSSGQRCDAAVGGSTAMGIDPRGAGRIQQCEIGSGLRSDLWRFDTDTLKWEEAAPDGAPDIPAPREGHTASLIGSVMCAKLNLKNVNLIARSRTNNVMWLALDHYWMVDVAPRTQVENTASDVIPLERGVHSTSTIELGDDELEGKCVSSLRVAVNIQHPCTSQLRIKLWGLGQPGHGMSAVLFNQHNGREDSQCGENITSTWFDDGASLPVRGCCNKSPFTGVFQPYELLGKFIGSPVVGNWTLDVFSSPSGDFQGELIDWTLIVSMQPCRLMDEGAMKWERVEVTGDDIPSPRAWHRAIAFEESIFVIGGVGGSGIETHLKQSMFRLDIKTPTWVKLAGDNDDHSTLHLLPPGMALIISPWGLFGLGGRNVPLKRGSETWLLNFVSLQWDMVYTNTSGAIMDTWEAGPVGLQRAAAAYVPGSSQIYLFGGSHAYCISGEMWKLSVNAIVAKHQSTAAHCGYRMATGGRTDNEWTTGCKALSSGGSCTTRKILQRAWCSQAYHTVR